ncbi:MAG: alpha/beta hydrolase-fold protein [Clostridiales bacterium]|nr:alpha/beta hydrolase-fold protein [Clostridiales bacterium]
MIENVDIAGRMCGVMAGKRPRTLLLLCCGPEPEELLEALRPLCPALDAAALAFPKGVEWDRDYAPWPSDELRGRPIDGGGAALYRETVDALLPALKARFDGVERTGIIGYSLGGLFALYAASQSDSPFDCAASVSGALWYEGFADYAAGAPFPRLSRAYLSLGRREAGHGRGPMGRVDVATQRIAGALSTRLGDENVRFEWNNGGHFFEIPQRLGRAITWLCKL